MFNDKKKDENIFAYMGRKINFGEDKIFGKFKDLNLLEEDVPLEKLLGKQMIETFDRATMYSTVKAKDLEVQQKYNSNFNKFVDSAKELAKYRRFIRDEDIKDFSSFQKDIVSYLNERK